MTTTKDHKPFCSAMVGDDAASIEVMVWPRIYEDTRDLWQEGTFLRIEGKVKVKDERIQVTCDAVEICNQEVQPKAVALAVPANSINGAGKAVNTTNGNGKNGIKQNGKNAELHKLTIVIQETDDEDKDQAYLNQLMEILKDSRGKDEVNLRILQNETITNMKLPNTYVSLTPDLLKRLNQVIKTENLIVENINNSS